MKKQLNIAGTEQPTIKEIDDAAAAYVTSRNKRMSASIDEKADKEALIEVMKKHGLDVYRVDSDVPMVVTITQASESVKVSEIEFVEEE